jgi:ubiquitin-activating enzyme E1 C
MECTNALATDRDVYPLCTIAETPRLPEHCILYYSILKWKEHFDRPMDKDSVDDINWICENAKKRAESFGIQGVTYSLTLGVVKNVIPAIASTNAIIAASTVLEAVKCLSGCSKILDNYFMYMGHEGIYSSIENYQKKEGCTVCSTHVIWKKVSKTLTLKELIE